MRSLTVILGCLAVAATCPAQPPIPVGGWLPYQPNKSNWTQLRPIRSPSAKSARGMVYDFARQRTILFGGIPNQGTFALTDTWEWDGKNWTVTHPTTSPSKLASFSVAHDSVRLRTVFFGERYNGGWSYVPETWEWNGKNWTQMKPTTSPSTRFGAAMVYDSARQRTVLFGGEWGFVHRNFLSDTWEWDGRNWSRMKPTSSPSARSGAAMVYDSTRQRTVLFGGRRGPVGGYLSDTWEWDGTNWAQIRSIRSPSMRGYTGMVHDSVRQRTVLFGGYSGYLLADTWEYFKDELTLTANTRTISIANGGTQSLTLNAGPNLKNKAYWMFGSASSTMPGVVLTGIHIPLRPDSYTNIVIRAANTNTFGKFKGTLSATGTAIASLKVPANSAIPSGFKLYHSYVVYDSRTGQLFTSSNPVSVEFK